MEPEPIPEDHFPVMNEAVNANIINVDPKAIHEKLNNY